MKCTFAKEVALLCVLLAILTPVVTLYLEGEKGKKRQFLKNSEHQSISSFFQPPGPVK